MGTMGSHIISERFAVQRVDQFMTKRLESIKKMTSYGAWLILALVAITQVDAQECDEITYGEESVEGLAWEGKCLYAVESNEGFQYAQAEAACASINGVLAPHMSSRDMIIAVSSYVSGENFIDYPGRRISHTGYHQSTITGLDR